MNFLVVNFLLILFVCSVSHGARILCIFNMPSTSHYLLGNTYARALAEAGHDVTMISPFEDKEPVKNGTYRNIVLTEIMEEKRKVYYQQSYFDRMYRNSFLLIYMSNRIGISITRKTLKHPSVQELIHSNETFDVVVLEQFFNDGLKGLAHHFKGHQILFSSISSPTWVNSFVGNPSVPTYSPDIFTGYSHKMNFLQRCYNMLIHFIVLVYKHLWVYVQHEKMMQEYIPNSPPIKDVIYNASLILLNSDPSVGFAIPKVPNMVEIGGFHIKPQNLTDDLKKFMDEAENGVILFSMGSTIKGVTFPEDKRKELVKTFAKLPQRVIWKWENDSLADQPENVKIVKWLPQQAVLAHPNLKLYISQGGYLSLTEAIHFGVPVIVIPIFADQPMNANVAEDNGYGVTLHLSKLSEEKLTERINEVLTNKKYTEVAKRRSQYFKDKPITPLQNAVYWTEYIIQHQGAPHLRVQALELNWAQYYFFDIYITVIVILLSIYYCIRKFR